MPQHKTLVKVKNKLRKAPAAPLAKPQKTQGAAPKMSVGTRRQVIKTMLKQKLKTVAVPVRMEMDTARSAPQAVDATKATLVVTPNEQGHFVFPVIRNG